VRVATTSVWVTSQRIASSSIRTGMWVIGSSKRCWAHSTRSFRVNPNRVPKRHESSTSLGWNALIASSKASAGSGSNTAPTASIPNSRITACVTSTLLLAASLTSSRSTI
jgi:hypothetical protein